MFKLFRKYNRILLVVLGFVLMVLFLIPQASNWFGYQPQDQPMGMIGQHEVSQGDLSTSQAEFDIVRALQQTVMRALQQAAPERRTPSAINFANVRLPDDARQWYFMRTEAEQMGLFVTDEQASAYVTSRIGISDAHVQMLAASRSASRELIDQAVRHFLEIQQLQMLHVQLRRVSQPQIRHFAEDLESKASVKIVAIKTDLMIEQIAEPTEAELVERYESNKADDPGAGEPYRFGYRLPPRIRYEYLQIPLEAVTASVQIDEAAAHRHYMEHPDEFVAQADATSEEASSSDADESASESTEEAAAELTAAPLPAEPTGPLPYSEVRQRIIDQLRAEEAGEKMRRMVNAATELLRQPERALEQDLEGYRIVDQTFAPLGLGDLAEQLKGQFNVQSIVDASGPEWVNVADLVDHEQLRDVFLQLAEGPLRLAYYMASCKELALDAPQQSSAPAVQVNIAGQALADEDGNRYLFRITAADAARQPNDLAEVRPQVLDDLKRLKAYKLVQEQAASYLATARAEGLDALAKTLGEAATVHAINRFSRRVEDFAYLPVYRDGRMVDLQAVPRGLVLPTLEEVGQSEAFVDGVFAMALRVQEAGPIDPDINQMMFESIAVDQKLTLCIVELIEYEPVTVDHLRAVMTNPNRLRLLLRVAAGPPTSDPFAAEALAARIGFKSMGEIETEPDEAAESDVPDESQPEPQEQAAAVEP